MESVDDHVMRPKMTSEVALQGKSCLEGQIRTLRGDENELERCNIQLYF